MTDHLSRFSPEQLSQLSEHLKCLSVRQADCAKTAGFLPSHASESARALAAEYLADADALANAADALTDFSNILHGDRGARSETKEARP